jgi:hypothetical protein
MSLGLAAAATGSGSEPLPADGHSGDRNHHEPGQDRPIESDVAAQSIHLGHLLGGGSTAAGDLRSQGAQAGRCGTLPDEPEDQRDDPGARSDCQGDSLAGTQTGLTDRL